MQNAFAMLNIIFGLSDSTAFCTSSLKEQDLAKTLLNIKVSYLAFSATFV
jgi:hypothetical protein